MQIHDHHAGGETPGSAQRGGTGGTRAVTSGNSGDVRAVAVSVGSRSVERTRTRPVLHVIVEKSNDRKLSSIATAAVILVFAIAAHAQSPHGRGSWPWISLFSRSMRELPENLKAVASLYLENM